ncbi:MAG: hypothetical protein P8Z36_13130 [Gemmatimonadota bacterium]|jgi:hypothetical protein
MTAGQFYVILGLVWIAASFGGGAFLAFLAKRIHPGLSFRKMWLFYTVLLSVAVAGYFAIAYW